MGVRLKEVGKLYRSTVFGIEFTGMGTSPEADGIIVIVEIIDGEAMSIDAVIGVGVFEAKEVIGKKKAVRFQPALVGKPVPIVDLLLDSERSAAGQGIRRYTPAARDPIPL